MYSILVLVGDAAVRDRVCGEIASGLQSQIYTASDVAAALALVHAEKPTLFLLTSEFALIHDKPIAEVVAELSPSTVVAFVAPLARSATPSGQA